MANYMLAIAFLRRTRCNKDQLYLFDIGNRGRIGELAEILAYTYICF